MTTALMTSETASQPRLRGLVLASVITALMLTLFLEALDQTIVGTAMPRIIAQLHGLDRYSWVGTAYILASMTMVPIVGKLSDQFGRKWFLIGGTLLFLLGSGLSGTAQSMNQLILFRGVQGLGAGIGMALVGTVMADLFPPSERAKWMGLFGMVYGVASLLGPTFGGWLVEHGPLLGSLVTEYDRWRWTFYINVPLGLIAMTTLLILLPAHPAAWSAATSGRRIDVAGALLGAAATITLMLGLTWGCNQTGAWTSPQVLGILATGILLFALFLFAERRAEEPILPLTLFSNRVFSMSALLALLQSMVMLGLVLYLPLFLQSVLALTPTEAGLVMTPFSLSMVAGAMISSQVLNRVKRTRIVAIGCAALMSFGAFLVTLMTPGTSLSQAILFLVLTGLGIGPFFSLPMLAVQNTLPQSHLGVSTAAVRYLGQLGATLGIAIVGTVVTSAASGSLMTRMPTSAAARLALSGALTHGFLAVLVFALLALFATCFLKEVPIAAAPTGMELERVDEEAEKAAVYA